MKYCNNCGQKLDADTKFCTECGLPVADQISTQTYSYTQPEPTKAKDVETPEEKKAGNTLGIISLCLYFGSPLISFLVNMFTGFSYGLTKTGSTAYSYVSTIIGAITGLSGLAAYVLMIVGRVKYPKNTLCKVVMWIYIGFLILGILSFIILVAVCYVTCSTMNTSGCN